MNCYNKIKWILVFFLFKSCSIINITICINRIVIGWHIRFDECKKIIVFNKIVQMFSIIFKYIGYFIDIQRGFYINKESTFNACACICVDMCVMEIGIRTSIKYSCHLLTSYVYKLFFFSYFFFFIHLINFIVIYDWLRTYASNTKNSIPVFSLKKLS